MRSVSVPQWGRIFSGADLSDSKANWYRSKPEDMVRWLSYLEMSATAATVLGMTESASEFFNAEKDLALLIPRNEWVECFFSLKNGFVTPGCPAQFLYFAQVIYKKYKICNLIGPMLPTTLSHHVKRKGYFGMGYTARDAVCNYINADYQPITDERPIVRCGTWYEVYVPCTDMVAALPLPIGKLLLGEDLRKLEFSPGQGLTLEGRRLTTFGGFQGVSNSYYDLRGLI